MGRFQTDGNNTNDKKRFLEDETKHIVCLNVSAYSTIQLQHRHIDTACMTSVNVSVKFISIANM